ncbi:hypothetical protein L1049_014164 [Liquidambar formosana]|uniref:Ribosomal protein L15 n=1 Tax=Liquidambar formosana TaxID=63359 RepID=A0AAP0RQ10_LIQFO
MKKICVLLFLRSTCRYLTHSYCLYDNIFKTPNPFDQQFSLRAVEIARYTKRLEIHRKKRGKVSTGHGHGHIGKHRKHLGGHGNARRMHHHRILFDKYYPGYFGKVGMRFYFPISQYRQALVHGSTGPQGQSLQRQCSDN